MNDEIVADVLDDEPDGDADDSRGLAAKAAGGVAAAVAMLGLMVATLVASSFVVALGAYALGSEPGEVSNAAAWLGGVLWIASIVRWEDAIDAVDERVGSAVADRLP